MSPRMTDECVCVCVWARVRVYIICLLLPVCPRFCHISVLYERQQKTGPQMHGCTPSLLRFQYDGITTYTQRIYNQMRCEIKIKYRLVMSQLLLLLNV